VHPGGRFVATAGWDDTVWLWDLDAVPAAGRPLRGHPDAVTALTWSADGTRLYSGDRSGGVRVWTDPLPLEPSALRAEIERWAASP
jgi:WD40 repeat protein